MSDELTEDPTTTGTDGVSTTDGVNGQSLTTSEGVGSIDTLSTTEVIDPADGVGNTDALQDDADTFPREYVEKIRKEAAEARVKAKRAEDLAREVFTLRVAATGKLADPNDLPFDETILDDPSRLDAAIDELISQHPHYATRMPHGDIGQGAKQTDGGNVDLAAMLRAGAR
ncbi:hypothetical protein [Propionimicrobium sp. PCR01-08-3]|uniref:hypothetical protein n=1 Tax=Propionimicrobium sp. PCR01-08-3 TaxID=3052086 RepID=UPI00255C4768|nr:hypothetical protein [Propionimicrobium sp. PCR01-08-3]WIY81387.1 hypothetical protein QQ658_07450 [Propionimicrobium sp. PCR01-08-3]